MPLDMIDKLLRQLMPHEPLVCVYLCREYRYCETCMPLYDRGLYWKMMNIHNQSCPNFRIEPSEGCKLCYAWYHAQLKLVLWRLGLITKTEMYYKTSAMEISQAMRVSGIFETVV